jgi:hypothetical protein
MSWFQVLKLVIIAAGGHLTAGTLIDIMLYRFVRGGCPFKASTINTGDFD